MLFQGNQLLQNIPKQFLDELLRTYREIARNFAESRWEPSELNGGKFCEVVYSILDGELSGTYPQQIRGPGNMFDACKKLESTTSSATRIGDRSLRVVIPRMLPTLFEFRNNRGVGHVGGDVNPNKMDACTVYQWATWIVAELIRIFHGVSSQVAQEVVSTLVERKMSLVWEIEGTKRVLDHELTKKDQTLILLYQSSGWTSLDDLINWIEYSNKGVFKKSVIKPMHDQRLIEFQVAESRLRITPKGIEIVETKFLRTSF